MKQIIVAVAIIYGLIPLIFLVLWLASNQHNIAAFFAMSSLVTCFALVMVNVKEIDSEDNQPNKEGVL